MLKLDKDTGNIDSLEDRLWAVANVISLEEHAFSSWVRTHDSRWLDDMETYRIHRRTMMIDILGSGADDTSAELWCIFKHCLAAAMRAYEAGNRRIKDCPEDASKYLGISEAMIKAALEICCTSLLQGSASRSEPVNNSIKPAEAKEEHRQINTEPPEHKAAVPNINIQPDGGKVADGMLAKFMNAIKCCRGY